MKTRALALLGSPLLALAPAAAAAQDWTNLGGNGQRNGLTSVQGPLAADPAWSDLTSPAIISWAPFTEGARVFTVRESGFPMNGGPANDRVVAHDLADGRELWSVTLPFGGDTNTEWIAWIGGVRDGRVLASRASHQKPGPLRALDAATGAILWTSTATTEAFAYDGMVFAPNGDPIVGDWQRLTRIDATSGATVWSVQRNRSVSGNCGAAVGAGAVYIDEVVPGGQVLTKIDLASGAALYSSSVMPGFTAQNAPFLSPDLGTVYFSRTQNNASVDFQFAFQDTGSALLESWSRPVRWTTSHEHGVGPDGSIYTFLEGNEFARLDPATGAVTASAGVLAPIGTSNLSPKTAVGVDGTVYVSNGWASSPATDGRLWAFTADLSSELFVLQLDRPNQGGPALASDGTLIVCDRAGVHAFRSASLGVSYCAGDGSATMCPCGNSGAAGAGCASSVGSGAVLAAGGTTGVAADDLVLTASGLVPGSPALLFAAQEVVNGGLGVPFGDGLRCAGVAALRLGVVVPGAAGTATFGPGLSAAAGWQPGDVRRLQAWYRDPTGPCGTGFNLSQGLELTFGP